MIHRTTQKFRKSAGRNPSCGFYPGICFATEEKTRKTLSQGRRRMPVGTIMMHTREYTVRIHKGKLEEVRGE
jgi:hypothetical protein